MARAIFGTSPKNEKKCKNLKIAKVTFWDRPPFFFDRVHLPALNLRFA